MTFAPNLGGRRHGFRATYCAGGCRCDECRAAESAYYRRKHPEPVRPSLLERLLSRIEHQADGCWHWTGKRSKEGYGMQAVKRDDGWENVGAHRLVFLLFVGPVPDELELDHLCRVRHCVNPAHLEAVTPRENVLRGMSPPAVNARKTHCPRGHPYDAENTYISPSSGYRCCKACHRERERQRRLQRKQAA